MSLRSAIQRTATLARLFRLKFQPVSALLARIRADELDVVAAWQAYTTLLSLVPLVALVLVIAAYVPGFAEVHAAFDQLLRAVRAIPAVQSATYGNVPPNGFGSRMTIENHEQDPPGQGSSWNSRSGVRVRVRHRGSRQRGLA